MVRVRDWDRLWHALPLAVLVVATLIAVTDAATPPAARAVTVALAVAAGGWHGWMVMAHPQWPERALAPMTVYYAGLLVLAEVLSVRHPAYLLMVVACFPMAFVALPGKYAYAGVVAAGLLMLGEPFTLAAPLWPAVPGAVASVVMTALIGWIVRAMEAEVGRRRAANQALEEEIGLRRAANQALEEEVARRRAANQALEEANLRLARLGEENAKLQGELLAAARQTGVAGERGRLAREIHDTVAQGLAGIVTQLEAADEVAADPDAVRHRLAVARTLARQSLTEVRRSLDDLRPGPLAASRLPEALSALVSDWGRTNELPATLTVTGTARLLHTEVEVTLFRAVQESLANVARHAGARKTVVTLSYMEDVVVADIRDDGRGFTPSDTPGEGFGLTAMRQRVSRLSGDVEVESAPGRGTAVSVSVPAIPAAGDIPAAGEWEGP